MKLRQQPEIDSKRLKKILNALISLKRTLHEKDKQIFKTVNLNIGKICNVQRTEVDKTIKEILST